MNSRAIGDDRTGGRGDAFPPGEDRPPDTVRDTMDPSMQGPSILARVNAVWRVPLILGMTGFLSVLSVSFSLVDGTGRMQHWCARIWSRFILVVSRVKVDVEGLEHLEPKRGYVFAANHLSMFDHWAFLACLPFQFRFVAKSSLFRIPFLGWHLTRSGNIPVARGNHRQTIRSFQKVSEKIREGISFVIYPEGMRSWKGEMYPFKRGAFLLARYSEAPVVPVTIIGAHKRLPRGSVIIRPGKMRLIIHPPLEFEDYRNEALDEVAEKVHKVVRGSYELE